MQRHKMGDACRLQSLSRQCNSLEQSQARPGEEMSSTSLKQRPRPDNQAARCRQVQSAGEKLWKRRRKIGGPEWLSAVAVCALVSLVTHARGSSLADYDGATFYKAPVGSRVRIACNGSHWDDEQSVSLVLWFKGTIEHHSVPIYTVDARQRGLASGARHFVADAYKGRARFVTNATPPYLDLAPLEAGDQSEYRCRIDYRAKPRENFLIILFVLVPPKSVHIMDSNGRSLEQIYGPLSEASNLTLLCLSRGGRPAPELTWRRGTKLIDDSYLTLTDFLALRQSSQLLAASSASESAASWWRDGGTEWPLAREKADRSRDNNQQQQQNSINADSSFAQLEALSREWRAWPENDFFARLLTPNASQHQADAMHIRLTDRKSASSGADAQQAAQQPKQQLLTMAVPESVTTSVNLLRLTSLSGLAETLEGEELQRGRPRLSCQASTAHYDLRTLIRLFAPPSLAGAELGDEGWRFEPLPSAHLAAPLAQLVEASGRALESSLRAAELLSGAEHQQRLPVEQLASTNSSQQITLDAHHPPARSSSAPGSGNGTHRSPGSVAAVIYQQLVRPHQLGTSSSPSSASGELPPIASQLISLDIYVRPLNVMIGPLAQRPLAAGQTAEFTCTTSGSQPPAKLSWFKNGLPLEQKFWRQINESAGNVSHSKLSLRLSQSDHRATLVCKAENEALLKLHPSIAASLEDAITLTVQYSPRLRLELGDEKLSNAVREGADIFFVCHVDAVPSIKEITWLHNQRPLNESLLQAVGEGLIISNNSLVLQRVRLEQRGQYSCLASNSEGVSESNRIELRVLHAPVCAAPDVRSGLGSPVLVASKALGAGARAKLLCRMSAEPADEVEFTWYLNNSHNERRVLFTGRAEADPQPDQRTSLPVSGLEGQPSEQEPASEPGPASRLDKQLTSRLQANSTASSQLSYSADSSLDYGRVYCLARNSLGVQKRACVYDILQPDPDEAMPFSCLAVNMTASSVWLACERPGSLPPEAALSGGKFALQLYSSTAPANSEAPSPVDLAEAHLEANLTAGNLQEPFFSVNGLRPETSYILRIRPLDGFSGRPLAASSLLRFSTTHSPARGHLEEDARAGEPYVEPMDEPQQRHLLSLISTRSTSNQHDLMIHGPTNASSRRSFQQQQLLQSYAARQQAQDGALHKLWSAVSSVFADVFARGQSGPNYGDWRGGQRQSQLMDTSSVSMITLGGLLLLIFISLALLLHRYSLLSCSRRRCGSSAKHKAAAGCKKSSHELHQTGKIRRDLPGARDSSQVISSKGAGERRDSQQASECYQTTASIMLGAPSPLSDSSNLSSRPRSSFHNEISRQQTSKQSADSFSRPSSFMLPDYPIGQPQPRDSSSIFKSRSSVCLETDLLQPEQQQQQQQSQQKLMQFSLTDIETGRLISDANLPLVDKSIVEEDNCWASYAPNCMLDERQSGYATRHMLADAAKNGFSNHGLSLANQVTDGLAGGSALLCEANDNWQPRSSFATIDSCQLIHPGLDPQYSYAKAGRAQQTTGADLLVDREFAALTHHFHPDHKQTINDDGLTQNMLAFPKQAERNQRIKLANEISSLARLKHPKRTQTRTNSMTNIISSSSLVSDESMGCAQLLPADFSLSNCQWAPDDTSKGYDSNQMQIIELIPPRTEYPDANNEYVCSKSCLAYKAANKQVSTVRPHLAVVSPSNGSLEQADPSPSSLTNTTLSQTESLLHHCDSKIGPQYLSNCNQSDNNGPFVSILKGSTGSRKASQY